MGGGLFTEGPSSESWGLSIGRKYSGGGGLSIGWRFSCEGGLSIVEKYSGGGGLPICEKYCGRGLFIGRTSSGAERVFVTERPF